MWVVAPRCEEMCVLVLSRRRNLVLGGFLVFFVTFRLLHTIRIGNNDKSPCTTITRIDSDVGD